MFWHGFSLFVLELGAIVLIDGTSQNYEAQEDILLQTPKKLAITIACTRQNTFNAFHQFPSSSCFPNKEVFEKTSGIRMDQDGSGWIAVCFFHRPTPPTPLRALAKPQEAAAKPKFSSSQLLSRCGDVSIMFCLIIYDRTYVYQCVPQKAVAEVSKTGNL